MKQTIPVIGMACANCSANVERALNAMEGVNAATVNLAARSANVDYDPSVISLEDMKKAISDIGYDMVIEDDRDAEQIGRAEYTRLLYRTIMAWTLSVMTMSISMQWISVPDVMTRNIISGVIALVGMVCCGGRFYVSAVRQLRHATANMDTLVALSTIITFCFSTFNTLGGEQTWGARSMEWHTYFDTCIMIITFVLTGRLLEEKAKDSTAISIRQLMGMTPKTARLVKTTAEGTELVDVAIATIAEGDIIEVRAGEKVPVDGTVTHAESFMTPDAAYIDEAMITGEPTPAEKRIGAKVMAGSIPSQGKLQMRAEQIGADTALAHIISMVQEAQGSKAPVQRIVDKAAMVFVPVVGGISLLTFLVWWLVGGNDALPQAVMSAVAVMVIACPCAMGLATPTALMVGIGKAAEQQVLIKDATALERLRRVTALVTDKTGTLTIPNAQVDFTKAGDLAPENRESLKPNARRAMMELKERGVKVVMMSGDNPEAAAYWAEKAGIDDYKAQVMPADKELMVKQLQQEGHVVAMVGDGINDTQALAMADVSIAIGRGTDVAMDVAMVTLMGDDLMALPKAMRLSDRTVHMIWQNLFWAFIYNIVCIPLAAGALHLFGIDFQISPMWASALMAMSSVSVVLNSLRLRYATTVR